jgi:hypothetical protein
MKIHWRNGELIFTPESVKEHEAINTLEENLHLEWVEVGFTKRGIIGDCNYSKPVPVHVDQDLKAIS